MVVSRWWHIAVLGTAIVLCALLLLDHASTPRLVGAVCIILAVVVCWFAIGPRAQLERRTGLLFAALVIVLTSVGAGFESSMATLQCIAFPLIWTTLDRLRDAVIGNIALALGVGVGMYFSIGGTPTALTIAASIEGVSLAFSLGLGLWINGIANQSDERRRLIEELESAQARLAILSREAGTFDERERLSREIHDTIAQDLTGLVLTAQRGLRELRGGNPGGAEAQLEVLEENARHALAETRALVASGAAVGVDGGGLAIALRRLGERFARETGIGVTVTTDDAVAVDRDAEVVLLRCAQEALANVRKHSAATSARLQLSGEDGAAQLRISDDGRGFDPTTRGSGYGLDGMRERLALVHGSLAVSTGPGGGTILVASLPLVCETTA